MLAGASVQNGVGGEHCGGEIGRAQQGTPHFLRDNAKLYHAEPRAAVLLRDVNPGQRELFAELAPDLGIIPLGSVHEAPDFSRGRFLLQKSPNRRAELFLLVRECELDAAGGLELRFV